MSGWLISIQKRGTYEIKTVAVSVPDQAAAVSAVEQACAGFDPAVRALRPLDAKMLQLHDVPAGGIRLVHA